MQSRATPRRQAANHKKARLAKDALLQRPTVEQKQKPGGCKRTDILEPKWLRTGVVIVVVVVVVDVVVVVVVVVIVVVVTVGLCFYGCYSCCRY